MKLNCWQGAAEDMAAPWASVKLPKDTWQRHRVLNTVPKREF